MASNRLVLICPKCHQFYSSDRTPEYLHCSDCGTKPLDVVDITYEQYSAFSPEAKETFQREYVSSRYPSGMTVVHTAFEPMGENKWSGFVQVVCWLVLALVVIAGLGMIFTGSILAGIAVIFIGFLSISGCMLFASIADDIRAIRDSVQRYIHYHP